MRAPGLVDSYKNFPIRIINIILCCFLRKEKIAYLAEQFVSYNMKENCTPGEQELDLKYVFSLRCTLSEHTNADYQKCLFIQRNCKYHLSL